MRRPVLVATTISLGALLMAPLHVNAQERAAGGVTIYDEISCPGNANSAKVTVPFSFGVTGLVPFSSSQVYVTDKDSQPEATYGPATIRADANGNVCLNINAAPAGTWKVDVVEQGSGFTDSKVFTVEGTDLPPVSTTAPASTAPPTPPPTTVDPTAPTTTVDPTPPPTTVDPTASTTTVDPNATTTAPATTTTVETAASTTELTTTVPPPPETGPPQNRPWSLLPWILERVTGELTTGPSPSSPLPRTGGSLELSLFAVAMIGLGGGLVHVARRSPRRRT